MELPITAVLASLLALLLVALSARVIGLRRRHGVSLGGGGHADLERAIRGQANFAEYAPIGLLLTLVAELQGANPVLLALLAAAFLAGRAMHGYCFAFTERGMRLRVGGMQLTVVPIVGLAIVNLAMAAIGLLAGAGG